MSVAPTGGRTRRTCVHFISRFLKMRPQPLQTCFLFILYIKTLGFVLVCPELIEELVRPKDLKFGRGVGNTDYRNNF